MTAKGSLLILAGPEYEDLEIWYPKLRVEEAGYRTVIAGLGDKSYSGKHGYPCPVDADIRDVKAGDVVGVLAPGGWAPDKIRRDKDVLSCVRAIHEAGKVVATICHGPWILISAGIVKGRRMTSTVGIRDDLVNAGAQWVDEPVVIDGNIISSRVPKDLPMFGRELVRMLDRAAG